MGADSLDAGRAGGHRGRRPNGKLQFYPKKYSGSKSLSVSGDELAAMCGNAGTGVGIVIDNDGRPGAFSNTAGMRLGFSLRDIATAPPSESGF